MPLRYGTRSRRRRYNKVSRKKTIKKVVRKMKRAQYNLTNVNMGLGFPKQLKMNHRYHQSITIASVAGAVGTNTFNANGLFDPDVTGGGTQPMYFDQVGAIYDHYTVIGSKVTVTAVCIGAGFAGVVGIYLNDDTAVVPNIDGILSNSKVVKKYINFAQSSATTFTMKWSAKKTFPGSVLGNNLLRGDIASNPTELSCYTIFFKTLDGSTHTVAFEINMEFIAIWNELKDIAQS